MNAVGKCVVAVAIVGIAGFSAIVFKVERYHRSGPPAQEQQERVSALQPLVQKHATIEQVSQTLGLQFEDLFERQDESDELAASDSNFQGA